MGENFESNEKHKNYPVIVKALKIKWILSSEYGKETLNKVLNHRNLEIYNVTTLRMVIEYFYKK